jgi:hypothetical protein
MAENADLSLMQKLIDRAVQDRLQPSKTSCGHTTGC